MNVCNTLTCVYYVCAETLEGREEPSGRPHNLGPEVVVLVVQTVQEPGAVAEERRCEDGVSRRPLGDTLRRGAPPVTVVPLPFVRWTRSHPTLRLRDRRQDGTQVRGWDEESV